MIKQKLPQLRKKLWSLLSLYVRLRDKRAHGVCFICKRGPIECAYHIIPAGESLNTKYDLDNLVGACFQCNGAEHFFRRKYASKHIELFGKDRYKELERRAAIRVKLDRADVVRMIGEVKKKMEINHDYS